MVGITCEHCGDHGMEKRSTNRINVLDSGYMGTSSASCPSGFMIFGVGEAMYIDGDQIQLRFMVVEMQI
jgi:hypothetical protein